MDDGSTESKLLEYMEKYSKDPRVMVLKNEKNSGVAFSLNHGLKCAAELDGVKYIARMDSDDISLKERLMVQVNFMESNPDVDICGTNMLILKQNSEPKVIAMPTVDSMIRFNMMFYCCLGHPTLMFKSSKVQSMIYNEDEPLLEDYDLWLRLCASNLRFANIG